MTIQHVLLDMDGVLCDFVTAALSLHGRSDVLPRWPAGEWSIPKVLGMSSQQFWSKIDAVGSAFWYELTPYRWMNELTTLIGRHAAFTILTSPSRDAACPTGKIQWLRKHLSPTFDAFMIGSRKHLCARADTVLIDDSDQNVIQFRKHGGQAILFPQIWNSNHHLLDPLAHVRRELCLLSPAGREGNFPDANSPPP